MLAILLLLTAADPGTKVSDVAPSLPATTRADEDRFDAVIDRFMLADTGRLRGEEGKKAVAEFDKLGPAAIPSLIRGLGRAARLTHSCPVLMIGKKLSGMLMKSQDPVLLEFARDELEPAAKGTPHADAVANLRVQLMLRKNALERLPLPPKMLEEMPTPGLVTLAGSERGDRKKAVLAEIGKRDGRDAMLALARWAGSPDRGTQQAAREALDAHLTRLSPSGIKDAMLDAGIELRKAAVRVAITDRELVWSVIDRVVDESPAVRAEARAALMKLSRQDFGPEPKASKGEQEAAKAKWRAWWEKQLEGK